MTDNTPITIERTYDATPEEIYRLWTTAEGIAAWWAPDGFTAEVQKLELRPGGELLYTFTATGAEQVAFMTRAGMPLRTQSRKTFTELVPGERLRYRSLVDFVPGVEAYEHDTLIELRGIDRGVRVMETIEPLHDEVWTERLVMGRTNELDNLAALIVNRP